jgi:ADP-ribose pyrophosphatase YjhB (NUDIX family)
VNDTPRFCVLCGGELRLRRVAADDRLRRVCAVCGHVHYENPKVVIGAACLHDGRVLLCRRAIEPRAGFWTVPAGFLELGESPEEGAMREAQEEARARIAIEGLVAVYSIPRIGQVQLLYRAQLLDPGVSPGLESLEVGLFGFEEIPWPELAFPTVERLLRRTMELRDTTPPFVPVCETLGPRDAHAE